MSGSKRRQNEYIASAMRVGCILASSEHIWKMYGFESVPVVGQDEDDRYYVRLTILEHTLSKFLYHEKLIKGLKDTKFLEIIQFFVDEPSIPAKDILTIFQNHIRAYRQRETFAVEQYKDACDMECPQRFCNGSILLKLILDHLYKIGLDQSTDEVIETMTRRLVQEVSVTDKLDVSKIADVTGRSPEDIENVVRMFEDSKEGEHESFLSAERLIRSMLKKRKQRQRYWE